MTQSDEVREAAERLIDAGRKGFVTCDADSPDYRVTVKFRTLEEAQTYHRALGELTLSLAE